MKQTLPFFPFLRIIYYNGCSFQSHTNDQKDLANRRSVWCLYWYNIIKLRKWKALRKHSLHGGKQPWFYWSCLSVVMKYATPLRPLAHGRNSICICKQHTLHDPWGQEKYNYTMIKYKATLYSQYILSTFKNANFFDNETIILWVSSHQLKKTIWKIRPIFVILQIVGINNKSLTTPLTVKM